MGEQTVARQSTFMQCLVMRSKNHDGLHNLHYFRNKCGTKKVKGSLHRPCRVNGSSTFAGMVPEDAIAAEADRGRRTAIHKKTSKTKKAGVR